jgi:hypothetical protein
LFKENQMLTLPTEIMVVLHHFAPVFSERIWDWAQTLVMGAILAPRQRTVCAALRAVGLGQERQFQNYHRVLNRAQWSGLRLARLLLGLLVKTLTAPGATLVLGADDTLERRRGAHIKAKGHFRDSARSSQKQAISSEGLRWLSVMLLTRLPFTTRVWALPFLTLLALHPQTSAALGKRHKSCIELLMQLVSVLRRWLPKRRLVLVTDGALVAVKLGLRCGQQQVTLVSRLRLDSRLFEPPPPFPRRGGRPARVGKRQLSLQQRLQHPQTEWRRQRVEWYGGKSRTVEVVTGTALWATPSEKCPLPLRWVLVRDPQAKFKPTALLCTDPAASPEQIIGWYVLRWNVEVTFQEARAHLGMETQRQWSDRAIERTTPALLGLFSLVTLLAQQLAQSPPLTGRRTAWYPKPQPTFGDALALVRRHLWTHRLQFNSRFFPGLEHLPRSWLDDLLETLCYAA